MEKPKYLQVKDMILEYIADKAPGTAIPSEREISNTYDASRMTIRRAIEELVEDGYLYREPNVGTYVAERRKKRTVSPVMLDDARKSNITYKMLYFNTYFDLKGEELINDNLGMKDGETAVRIVRLMQDGETAICIEDIYISRALLPNRDFADIGQYLDFDRYIEEGGISETFIPTIVPTQYAKLLNIKINTPIIRIDNLISKANGQPFIFVQSYYNPDKKKIMIHI